MDNVAVRAPDEVRMRIRRAVRELDGLEVEAETLVHSIYGRVYVRRARDGHCFVARIEPPDGRYPTDKQWYAIVAVFQEAIDAAVPPMARAAGRAS